MLRIVNLEEIQSLLLRLPKLIDRQERGDASFPDAAREWLSQLEQIMERNRMPQAGSVAALRSLLASAEGGLLPEKIQLQGRPTRRKIRQATAGHVLREGAGLTASTIHKDQERIADAERMTRQLVAVAKTRHLLGPPPNDLEHTAALQRAWQELSAIPELVAGTANVEALVGPHDALVLLDRMMTCDLR